MRTFTLFSTCCAWLLWMAVTVFHPSGLGAAVPGTGPFPEPCPQVKAEKATVCQSATSATVFLVTTGDPDEYQLTPVGASVGLFLPTDGFQPLSGSDLIIPIQKIPEGEYEFELVVRNSQDPDCISNAVTFPLTVDGGPEFSIFAEPGQCPETEVSIDLEGDLVTAYEWSGASAFGIPDGTAMGPVAALSGTTPENTTGQPVDVKLEITATNEKGCTNLQTKTLTLYSTPVANDTKVEACSGAPFSYELQNMIGNGQLSDFTYSLKNQDAELIFVDDNQGGTDNIFSGTFTNPTSQTLSAVFEVTPSGEDAVGCTGSAALLTVEVPPVPAGENVNATVCSGQSTGVTLVADLHSTAAATFDVAFLTKTGNVEGEGISGSGLAPDAIKSDTYFNRSGTAGTVVYEVTPVSAGGCAGDPFEVSIRVLPTPQIGSALQIAGVDFPSSGTCGNFNVIMDLKIENIGEVSLMDLQAAIDLGAPSQFGAAFVGLAPDGAPQIVATDADSDPALAAGWNGSGDFFDGNSGRLAPGQSITVRFAFEIFPEKPSAPAAPVAQAAVSAMADYSVDPGLAGVLNPCRTEDLSDSGTDPAGINLAAPGDSGGEDDPTPLGSCYEKAQQVAVTGQIYVSTDENCSITVTPDMLIENYKPDCDTSLLPLGGYYRVFHRGEEVTGPLDMSDAINALLVFEIRTVNSCEPVWGYVTPEDVTPPVTECPGDVHGFVRYPEPDNGDYAYRAAAGPEEAGPGESFNRLVCTEIDSIYQNDDSWRDPSYRYYIGLPSVADPCGTARIIDMQEKLDEFNCGGNEAANGNQYTARLSRTFFFEDEHGNKSSCTQEIYFYRPYVFLPECKVELDQCLYGTGEVDLSPAALGSAPYFITGTADTLLLTEHSCDLTVDYKDESFESAENCGQKIIRTWSIIDWCRNSEGYTDIVGRPADAQECPELPAWTEKVLTFEQHLVIGDVAPPVVSCPDRNFNGQSDVLIFSAGPLDCTGVIAPPEPEVSGECQEWTWEFELYGEVFDPKRNSYSYELIGASSDHMLSGVPTGDYELYYVVTDACGNTTVTEEPCRVIVRDGVDPVALCNDQLNVSIGGENIARVSAEDVDEGSWDNCGTVALDTRRSIDTDCLDNYVEAVTGGLSFQELEEVNNETENRLEYYAGNQLLLTFENGTFFSWWASELFFTCCDIATGPSDQVTIELRATDRGGNQNTCWMRILVEDKLPPRCVVDDAAILCTEVDFDPSDPLQVAARFGSAESVVSVTDNCGAAVEEQVVWLPENCGTGVIERRFTVTDASGFSSTCTQLITVEPVNHYAIRFPGDFDRNECGAGPEGDIATEVFGCDLLAVDRDTARYDASGDECFKMFITYSVIDWCEYDGETVDPTVIPRDLDQDGNFEEDTWMEALDDPAFVEAYLPEETETFVVKVYADGPGGQRADLPEQVFVRTQCVESGLKAGYRIYRHLGDGVYERSCEEDASSLCTDADLPEAQCWTPGFYEYTQLVKVYDQEAPFIEILNTSLEFCAYGDAAVNCDGQVGISFRLQDDCTPGDTELRNVRLFVNGDPEQVITLDEGIFNLNQADGVYTLYGSLPTGNHRFLLQAVDGCGNLAGLTVDFSVVDCKAPAPVCINGIAIELMPVDTDGDGDPDTGMNTIWATDYIARAIDDCGGSITYSINWKGDTPDRDQSSLTVSCDDPLFETLPVEVHAWDSEGNHDYCETFLVVEDLQELCPAAGEGSLAGLVTTEGDEPVENVRIQLSGQESRFATTEADGLYSFPALAEGYDYSVQANLDENPGNGVSTFDLIQISKHILGVKQLGGPYRLIAADVNDSGSVTTLDLIQIRKLILGVQLSFPNNTSWRFVPASYTFANPASPWQELEALQGNGAVINYNDFSGTVEDADFVAVKVGDVNGNAVVNSLQGAEVRNVAGTFTIKTDGKPLRSGVKSRIDFYADDLESIEGYQFSLQIKTPEVELIDLEPGTATKENFGIFPAEGTLTVSWDKFSGTVKADEPLFSLVLQAKENLPLREVLKVNSRRTRAEAYGVDGSLLDVALDFGTDILTEHSFALHQNRPNPFQEITVISFELPEAGNAVLKIRDVNGRLLHTVRGTYGRGYHEVRLDQKHLPGGILYYTLETERHTASRKMILIK